MVAWGRRSKDDRKQNMLASSEIPTCCRRRQVAEAFYINKTSLVTNNQLTMGTYAERSTFIYSMPP